MSQKNSNSNDLPSYGQSEVRAPNDQNQKEDFTSQWSHGEMVHQKIKQDQSSEPSDPNSNQSNISSLSKH